MQEIVRESEISMSTRENSLSNQANDDVVIDRGGVYGFRRVCLSDTYQRLLQNGREYPRRNDHSDFGRRRMKEAFRKQGHPQTAEGGQGWEPTEISDTLNVFNFTELRTPILIVEVNDE